MDYSFGGSWNDSAGSSEHSFQKSSSLIYPALSFLRLMNVAEIWPPSAESKTTTTPATGAGSAEISRYAFKKSDFAYLRFACGVVACAAGSIGATQIIFTTLSFSNPQVPAKGLISSRLTRKSGAASDWPAAFSAPVANPEGVSSCACRIQPREGPEI